MVVIGLAKKAPYASPTGSDAVGHKTLLPSFIAGSHGRENIMVVCGGFNPAQEYDFIYQNGASAIFGPSTDIPDSARKILRLLQEQIEE